MRLEVLHNVEELIVDVGLVVKLDLDLVKVRQGVLKNRFVSHDVLSW